MGKTDRKALEAEVRWEIKTSPKEQKRKDCGNFYLLKSALSTTRSVREATAWVNDRCRKECDSSQTGHCATEVFYSNHKKERPERTKTKGKRRQIEKLKKEIRLRLEREINGESEIE
ncbi:hypothetical protein K9L63_00210 [Candidatus Gracilibacteria bacterium]|nr:hypothetical protein [Candidatus Gracilibacteria bacterium]